MKRTGARVSARVGARVKPAWIGQPHGRTGIAGACTCERENTTGVNARASFPRVYVNIPVRTRAPVRYAGCGRTYPCGYPCAPVRSRAHHLFSYSFEEKAGGV
jgi:hypothetical protein